MHVGQPVMASLKQKRQPSVLDAQAVQHCGVQIMDMDRVTRDVVAEIIGFAMRQTGFDAAAGQPER